MINNIGLPGLIVLVALFTGPVFVAPGWIAMEVIKPVPHPGFMISSIMPL